MTAPIDRAKAYFTDHGACPVCQHPVNDQGTGAWVHTTPGTYTCPPGTSGSMAGEPITDDAIEAAVDKAVAETEEVLRDMLYDEAEVEDRCDTAREEGRKDMYDEIDTVLSEAFDSVTVGPGATAADAEKMLRDALATVWNRVVP